MCANSVWVLILTFKDKRLQLPALPSTLSSEAFAAGTPFSSQHLKRQYMVRHEAPSAPTDKDHMSRFPLRVTKKKPDRPGAHTSCRKVLSGSQLGYMKRRSSSSSAAYPERHTYMVFG